MDETPQIATAVQASQTSACPHPEAAGQRWGDPISEERKAELDSYFHKWAQHSSDDADRERPFDAVELTGADVFWLSSSAVWPFSLKIHRDFLHLAGAVLEQAHLEGADLRRAHLRQGMLRRAHLEGANLADADLQEADLCEVHLEGANLARATLKASFMQQAHLEGANLDETNMEEVNLQGASLKDASLQHTRLDRADLRMSQLQAANLFLGSLSHARLDRAHLEAATLVEANLEGANLQEAQLERADLRKAHLEGANLEQARLEGSNLREARLDSKTVFGDATFDGKTWLGDIQWSGVGGVNLSRINWERVPVLGDEQRAWLKARVTDMGADVRAYRQVATQLRAQGMSEVADRFAYRAQVRQRGVLLRRFRIPQYLGSWLLDLVSGYGYKPWRSLLTYMVVILAFSAAYLTLGSASAHPLSWNEAIVISMTAFHGRGFFSSVFQPGDVQAAIAAAEAFIGLLIEIVFIATFTNRFFAR